MNYVISERALQTIVRECQRYPDAETGGILVGFREPDDDQVIVTHASGPGPGAERSAVHFVKDTAHLQSVLNLLFQYYQTNYLGVWHKHPQGIPVPSTGDVASAMDELADGSVGLDELLTPICVMKSGLVDVFPFVISDNAARRVLWSAVPHDKLPTKRSVSDQWHGTSVGQERLAQEVARFKELGVDIQVRRGSDGTFRFHAPLGSESPLRLVMLCQGDYPVTAPEVALHDERTKAYAPVESEVVDGWHIDRFLSEIYLGYRDASATPSIHAPSDTVFFQRPQV